MLTGKHIVLGVTGGIAAYKAPQLVRDLTALGAEVQVVLSNSAEHFVGRSALAAVSGRAVRDSLWDEAAEAAMGHIELARWADAIVIAPATAHCLSGLATGAAGDLLSTIVLATTAPVFAAPAMNQQMWQSPATQRNVATLQGDGVQMIGPASGDQACGEVGPGRMVEPADIAAAIDAALTQRPQSLVGKRVTITAGPTVEAIDPVRYLSNHSSGKQGYALAQACAEAGASVTLISGPVNLDPPAGVELINVTSALSMQAGVEAALPECDVFIGVAAVADYRVAETAPQKMKRAGTQGAGLTLELVENPDIIAAVASASPRPFVVGFAAETEHVEEHARDKLARKKLDLIVVNDVSRSDIGFGGSNNAVTVIDASSAEPYGPASKLDVSRHIVAAIARRLS